MERRTFLALPLMLAVPQTNLNQLPANLPRPKDDGGARRLKGMTLPDLELPSTANRRVNLSKIAAARVVICAYPMTGRPDRRHRGRIEQVFYPVFPPDKRAEDVIAWLKKHPA